MDCASEVSGYEQYECHPSYEHLHPSSFVIYTRERCMFSTTRTSERPGA